MRQLACKEGDGRRTIEALRSAADMSGEAEAAAETASQPIRSSDRRAAKRAEAGPCVGRAADRLTVDVGDEEDFHGSREEDRRAAAIGLKRREPLPGGREDGRKRLKPARKGFKLRSGRVTVFEAAV